MLLIEVLEDRNLLSASGLGPVSLPPLDVGSGEGITILSRGNNSWNTALDLGTITATTSTTDDVGFDDGIDFYEFRIASQTNVRLDLTGLSADIDLYLYRGNRRYLAASTNAGSQSERLEGTLSPGTYYAIVYPWGGARSDYDLSISVPRTDTAGNSFGAARNLGSLEGTSSVEEYLDGADVDDYYRFDLAEDSVATFTLTGLTADVDVGLYDASGTLIDSSINTGNSDERIDAELAAGTYYLRANLWETSGASDYDLSFDIEFILPEDNVGNTFNTAQDLGSVDGTVQFSEDVGAGNDSADYFRFDVARRADTTITLAGLSQDIDLYLFDGNQNLITYSWNGGSTTEQITRTLEAGTYYINVSPWNGAESSYTLTVTAQLEDENDGSNGVTPFAPVSDSGHYWNINAVNAPEAWAQGHTGQGIVVAIVDTGVDLDHPEFAGRIWVNQGETPGNGIDDDGNGYIDDVNGYDFAGNDNNPDDQNGHGTHVAGIVAASLGGIEGVAPGATIMPVQVLGANGSGSSLGVANGILYAARNGADVINLSLGSSVGDSRIANAIAQAEALGAIVVAASGNEGASQPGYPARYSNQITGLLSVGSHTQSNFRSSFSNQVGSSGAVQVDAPGSSISSAWRNGGYVTISGTSMATPHVAGLAALILSANDDLLPAQVRQLIVNGADRTINNSDSEGGVNAAWSVAAALVTTRGGFVPNYGGSGGSSGGTVGGSSIDLAPTGTSQTLAAAAATTLTNNAEERDEVVSVVASTVDVTTIAVPSTNEESAEEDETVVITFEVTPPEETEAIDALFIL